MEAIRMIEFCNRTGMLPCKLTRRIKEFDIIYKEGWKKPWIKLSEKNLLLADLHSRTRLSRKKLPRLTKEEYRQKYGISEVVMNKWFRSMVKEMIDETEYICDTSTNRRLILAAQNSCK